MRRKYKLIIVALLLASSSPAFTQAQAPLLATRHVLRNSDVLLMVKKGIKPDIIIAEILNSSCAFDTFPPVLHDLRRRGVPDALLQTMVKVPSGPPTSQFAELASAEPNPRTRKVKMPRGTEIQVETAYPVSSDHTQEGSTITLLVVQPVYIDGVLTIGRGAVAKARVAKAKKAQSWGRAGALDWEMEYIVAVDGTQIPSELSDELQGNNRAGQLAVGAALTSALIFPYTAPVALVWGFKKGDDAVLRGSRRFAATVSADTEVAGLVSEGDRVIYHFTEGLNAKLGASSTVTAFPRLSVR
jgi:hypothetical protein